jgi:trk system potassium uptake protein TrkA
LGIDAMVFPEDLAAKEMLRLIKRSSLTDSFEFGDGRLTLTGVILEDNAPIINKNIVEAVQLIPGLNFTVVAIQRKEKTIVPRGDTHFLAGDHIYFISHPERLGDIMNLTGKRKVQIRNIMILGGGLIAELFAKKTQAKYHVKLIESDRNRCYELADKLNQTLVIHGDGSDVELLEEEGISEMDAFIAVTQNSDTNIISSLVARNHGVMRTIALVENINYISLSQNIGVDTLINKKLITVNNIFRYVREGKVAALTSLHGVDSEILEFVVHKESKITRAPIKDLHDFPREAVIGGLVRGKKAMIATGDLQIQEDDHVVVFTLSSSIAKIESFFK